MNCKIIVLLLILLSSCKIESLNKNRNLNYDVVKYENKGFTLIYTDELLEKKIIKKKIDDRSLGIYHEHLLKGTKVKITNLINNESLIATVLMKVKEIKFYNSIISKRIASELKLQEKQPYIEIEEIRDNFVFIAKKTKTYDAEKNVADKAPVDEISINDLNSKKKIKKPIKLDQFIFYIKVADFYFLENAQSLINRILNETLIKEIKILEISKNKHRVYIGPFDDINSLQKAFFSINNLGFENIEIIKNAKS